MNSSTFFMIDNVICPQCGLSIPISSMESHELYHSTIRLLNTQLLNESFQWFPLVPTSYPNSESRANISPVSNHSISPLTFFAASRSFALYDEIEDDYEMNTMIADMLGNVEVGVSDINKVSTKVELPITTMNCGICLDNVNEPRKLLCDHVYCDGCISTWLSKNKTCPSCRVDLEDALKENEKIDTGNNK